MRGRDLFAPDGAGRLRLLARTAIDALSGAQDYEQPAPHKHPSGLFTPKPPPGLRAAPPYRLPKPAEEYEVDLARVGSTPALEEAWARVVAELNAREPDLRGLGHYRRNPDGTFARVESDDPTPIRPGTERERRALERIDALRELEMRERTPRKVPRSADEYARMNGYGRPFHS